jgi:hypothetical protein
MLNFVVETLDRAHGAPGLQVIVLMDDATKSLADLRSCKTILVHDLVRVAARDRWGQGLLVIGWLHLGFFLICQVLYARGDRAPAHFIPLWMADVAAVLISFRLIAGPGWMRATPLAGVIVRVWATYLILAFNAATMNGLMGWSAEWFKPSWATLATFGFATMAWLIGLRFLIPAVQMYFTGLLMIQFPQLQYLIFGLSWWLALQAIGLVVLRRPGVESTIQRQDTLNPEKVEPLKV